MIDGWRFDDGGRRAAGYSGLTGDCACRAIALATRTPYTLIYDALNKYAARERMTKQRKKRGRSTARNGVYKATYHRLMSEMFPDWEWVATMGIGTGCHVHLSADELPRGRLIVAVSKHLTCMIDGIIHDTHDPRRSSVWEGVSRETRCVYGYYRRKE